MKKYIYIASLTMWALTLGLCVYWYAFDNPVIYYDENISADGPTRAGDTLVLNSNFCQSRPAVQGTAERRIKNQFVYALADQALVSPAGCYHVRREVTMPSSLVPGPHTYEFEATFRVNPIKTVQAHIKPVPFEVLP